MSGEPRWSRDIRRAARAAHLELPADVVEEFAAHLDDIYLREIARGRAEGDAVAAALAALQATRLDDLRPRGRIAPERESRLTSRAPAGAHLFDSVSVDIRYALRLLRRTPAFSLSLIAILALSIGAASAVFSVVDAVLLRPLPYGRAEKLALLQKVDKDGRRGAMSAADWVDYGSRVEAFDGVAAYATWTHNLSGDGEPLRLRSIITSGISSR